MRVTGTIDDVGVERVESVSMAGHIAMGDAAHGALTVVPRAIGVMLALAFAPLRMLLIPSLMAGGRRDRGPDSRQVPATPFLLAADDGTHYDCVLRGEVRGAFLKLGERVEVAGRLDRGRVLRVSEVRSTRTGAITRGWVDPRVRAAKAQTIAGCIALGGLLLVLVSILTSFGGR